MRLVITLVVVGALGVGSALAQQGGMMSGGRGGMMGGDEMAPLKEQPPERTVEAVRYCEGQYFVTTAMGDVLEFPEFNFRIKTDCGERGPPKGKPALLPAGMIGDRAFLIFSEPGKISGYIENTSGNG